METRRKSLLHNIFTGYLQTAGAEKNLDIGCVSRRFLQEVDLRRQIARSLAYSLMVGSALFIFPQSLLSDTFSQTNLVSDMPGLAPVTDANLKNPWGVSFAPTSPFWVSNQVTNNSTLYSGTGSIVPLVVSVPGGPTGQVFTGASSFSGSPLFTFATLGGSIYTWTQANGTTAQLAASTPGAAYTGLALGSNASGDFLYAAKGTGIDVFDSNFNPASLSGKFVDTNLPAGYTPYNIQNVNGQLYVEYANFSNSKGAVSVFDTNGNFVKELVAPGGSHLNNPWGVVIAPAGFGSFANALLVGNLGNGEINAFNPASGTFLGTLSGGNGQPLVNDGLWALTTRTGSGFDTNAVYFTAGINGQQDGLFGRIDPTPEPLSVGLSGLGCLLLCAFAARRRWQEK
jgi:uncharacterized protein (TIGR03118 family)